MIRLCTCGKYLGRKKLFKRGITHGLCQDCFERQIFKIKGYTFKWLKYNGWKHITRVNSIYMVKGGNK